MSDIDKPLPDSDVTLNLRAIMSGKEVGSIIGRGGETINSIREESGANIYISDSSMPERIVAVKGPTDSVYKAYTRICKKLEENEERSRNDDRSSSSRDSGKITLRLVVPASQCGSLIGRGGAKIKEIREETGANVQVASDPLPQSTERAVTVSGTRDSVNQTVYHICVTLLETPAKDGNVQYQPGRGGFNAGFGDFGGGRGGRGGPPNPIAQVLGAMGGGSSTLAALATFAESQSRGRSRDDDRESSFQMSVPNHLIGSVIGSRGSKIAEIRNMSGAMIKISRSDESDSASDRSVEINGNPNSVALAKSLINLTLDKAAMENEEREGDGGERRRDRRDDDRRDRYRDRHEGPDMNIAGLLGNPEIMKAVTTLSQLAMGGGGGGGGMGMPGGYGQMGGGMNRGRSSYGGSGRSRDDDRRDSKRSKFAPY